jgi:hypothetical protein
VLSGGAHKWGVSTCYQAGHTSAQFATGVAFRGGACAGGDSAGEATDVLCAGTTGAWTYSGEITGVGTDITTATHTLCRYDMNGFRAKITFTKNPGDINELTCDADLVTTVEHIDSKDPSTDIVCTAKDRLNLELGAINTVVGSTIGGGNGGQIQTNMDLSHTMTHGDRLSVQGKCSDYTGNDGNAGTSNPSAQHCWADADCTGTGAVCGDKDGHNGGQAAATYTIAGPTTYSGDDTELTVFIVEEETAATTALDDANSPASYWQGKGTTENTECSHRGLCNHDEGLCECFTGYTHDDCSMQDALNA